MRRYEERACFYILAVGVRCKVCFGALGDPCRHVYARDLAANAGHWFQEKVNEMETQLYNYHVTQ